MGITSAHRTASTRAPRRPARQTAVSQCTAAPPPGTQLRPDTQHLVAISLPKSHGQPPRTPHPVSPWERRLDHGCSSARAAKTFTPGTGRPSENSGPSALRFLPNAAAFLQAPSAPQGAPRGGGPQHEKADSHGKEHRQKIVRGHRRAPEPQGHRGPGGELGARLGQYRLHLHRRREVRLSGHHHQMRGLQHTQGGARPEALRTHRGSLPRRVRGGGLRQHPLRHRESAGDGLGEGAPAPPQEHPQRREMTLRRLPRAFGLGAGRPSSGQHVSCGNTSTRPALSKHRLPSGAAAPGQLVMACYNVKSGECPS